MAIDPGKLQALARQEKKGKNPFGGGHDDGGDHGNPHGGKGNGGGKQDALGMLKSIRAQMDKAIAALSQHESDEGDDGHDDGHDEHDDGE